jgi:hypothetical protein
MVTSDGGMDGNGGYWQRAALGIGL